MLSYQLICGVAAITCEMKTKLYILSQLPDIGRLLNDSIAKRIKHDVVNRSTYENIEVVQILPEKGQPGQYVRNLELTDSDLKQMQGAQLGLIDNNFIGPVIKHAYHNSISPMFRWIQNTWAGVELLFNDQEVIKIIKEKDIMVTRFSGDYFGHIMFDYVFGQIINYERHFNEFYKLTKMDQQWNCSNELHKTSSTLRRSDELSALILGASGSIGSYVSKKLSQIGMKCYGYGRKERSNEWLEQFYKDTGVVSYSNKLEDFLPLVDYVISILPNTSNTDDLLNSEMLKLCSKRPVLINTGRGNVISEECLIESLKNGWLSYAILDVFREEPLPPQSKLWNENVLITPHIAAITRASDVVELLLDNYIDFVAGRPLRFSVDLTQGY